MTKATIVVFGGSGFIGTHLLQRLLIAGEFKLVSFDRRPPQKSLEGVEYVTGDVADLSKFELEAPVAAIYNFAAVHTTPGHEPWEYYDTNIHGALQILDFARKVGCRFIHFTSTMSVYGPDEAVKYENSEPTPISDYGRSKLMAEAIHKTWLNESPENRLVISRPAVVFGLGEKGNFTRLGKLISKGFFVFPGHSDTIKSCIYVEDLVDWMLHAEKKRERFILFNGAFSNRYTIGQIVAAFETVAGGTVRKYTIPAGLLKFIARLAQPLSKATGLGLHPDRVEKLLTSTNIYPGWAEKEGLQVEDLLEDRLSKWRSQSGGSSFD